MEKEKERNSSLLVWTMITLASLGMVWQGLLADKIAQAVVIFIYFMGIAMMLKKKKDE